MKEYSSEEDDYIYDLKCMFFSLVEKKMKKIKGKIL